MSTGDSLNRGAGLAGLDKVGRRRLRIDALARWAIACGGVSVAVTTEGGVIDQPLVCLESIFFPRKGQFEAHAGFAPLCRLDMACEPCFFDWQCPGDRICGNLGLDNDTLASYHCIDPCAPGGAPCADGKACSDGFNSTGDPMQACFEIVDGAFPLNHCAGSNP